MHILSLVIGAVAVAIALLPFTIHIPLGRAGDVHVRCRTPIVSAWDRGAKDQLGLWAVTVGTNMASASPVLGAEGPFAILGRGNDVRFVLLGGAARFIALLHW